MLDPKDYRDIPIPNVKKKITALDYSNIPYDFDHELSDDPIENCFDHGLTGESYYARKDGYNSPYYTSFPNALDAIYLRRTLIDKLIRVNENLSQIGLELFLVDGYRPISLQQDLWNFFVEQGKKRLETLSQEDIDNYAGHYVSDPRKFNPEDSTTWPIHSTGGSIDVMLKRKDHPELLFMGGVFDDPTDVTHTRHFENIASHKKNYDAQANPGIASAVINRRILYHAMTGEGFTNYMYEWWHFDYGNQMWAINKNTDIGTDTYKAFYQTAKI